MKSCRSKPCWHCFLYVQRFLRWSWCFDKVRKVHHYWYLHHFVKGGNDSLKSLRRESMFIQLLEGLHADEANLLCKVKDRRLEEDYKITIDIVKEAYPDVKWGWRK